jgi:hypothetical protein
MRSTEQPPRRPATGPLRVHVTNPRYFADVGGKPVYLTGSHTWVNFKDYGTTDPPPAFDYERFLDFLEGHHHNFFRLWAWELPRSTSGRSAEMWHRTPFPWPRTGPGSATDGKPRFDLSRLDPAYFDRLRNRVIAARDRGFYVAVMLWDGYGLQNNRNEQDGFPFAGGNNINGIDCGGTESQSLTDPAVTVVQEAYARKVVDTVNDLENVLYEIANESGPYSTGWHYHMICFIQEYEKGKPVQHPVGMTRQIGSGTSDEALYESPADWISPAARVSDANGRQVIINDTDHSYYWVPMKKEGPVAHVVWAWKNFLKGNNTAFMDPYLVVWPERNAPEGTTPDPYWDPLRRALGDTRRYAEKMDLAVVTPRESLSSTGFCLADPGAAYLVLQPESGPFTVDLQTGSYSAEWFDPIAGTNRVGGRVDATGKTDFTPPFTGPAVLYLRR